MEEHAASVVWPFEDSMADPGGGRPVNAHGMGVRGRRLSKDVAAEGGRGQSSSGDEGSHEVVGAAAKRDHGREIVGD
jgi:hypothetical protein